MFILQTLARGLVVKLTSLTDGLHKSLILRRESYLAWLFNTLGSLQGETTASLNHGSILSITGWDGLLTVLRSELGSPDVTV